MFLFYSSLTSVVEVNYIVIYYYRYYQWNSFITKIYIILLYLYLAMTKKIWKYNNKIYSQLKIIIFDY